MPKSVKALLQVLSLFVLFGCLPVNDSASTSGGSNDASAADTSSIGPVDVTSIRANLSPTPMPNPTATPTPTPETLSMVMDSGKGPGGKYVSPRKDALSFSANVSGGAKPYSFGWSFGDDATTATSSEASISHAYQTAGIFNMKVTVTDSNGSSVSAGTEVRIMPRYQGLYSLGTGQGKTISAVALAHPKIDGVHLRAKWDGLNPTEGNYDWTWLDKQIIAARDAGKTIALSIGAGDQTPTFVYDAGARYVTDVGGARVPVPWDLVFQAKFKTFLQAVAAHFDPKTSPSVAAQAFVQCVSQLKITGINYSTNEFRLPTDNEIPQWQTEGYTPKKMTAAFEWMLALFVKNFPYHKLSISIVGPKSLPNIDDSGKLTKKSGDSALLEALIDLGYQKYPNQFMVQNNGISTFWISKSVYSRGDVGKDTGYQTLWSVTGTCAIGGPADGCRMNDYVQADAVEVLQKSIDMALPHTPRFIEIYEVDVKNAALQTVIDNAYAGLPH